VGKTGDSDVKLLWVVGSAYSGSSMLSVLLDRIRGVVSVGEGARCYKPHTMPGPCATCKQLDAKGCEVYRDFAGYSGTFYEFCKDAYPNAHTIVDSTKDPAIMLEERNQGRRFDTRAVMLSKRPIEAFSSYYNHPREMSAKECVSEWYRVNLYYLGVMALNGIEYINVHYNRLATDPVGEVGRIVDHLGLPTWEERDDADQPCGHILGGNPSVSSIVSGVDSLCFRNSTRASYMNGKYSEATDFLIVDYDTSYLNLPPRFVAELQREIDQVSDRYTPLLALLGYGPQEVRLL
jgi:hypothetical protein